MKITYSIQVCDESRELYSLLNFLIKVIDKEDNINVVVDTLHVTDRVKLVLDNFKNDITIFERPFDTFYKNSMFHLEKCTGDYNFGIDADEMPQETLIKELKKTLERDDPDIVFIPRINIMTGVTQEFITKNKIIIDQVGHINWPDYQGRICKKDVEWTDELHTKPIIEGKKIGIIGEHPGFGLWHIKSLEKQDSRWVNGTITAGNITGPSTDNLYDLLM